jgi:hypothetical protein
MITFNVYYGLNAWTNHTFVANEFCSNGGNAYVCITPGPSTAAPTGTGTGINNGGIATFNFESVVNYASLQAWATDMFNTYGTPGQPDNFTIETWASAVITMPMVTPSSPYLGWGGVSNNGFSTLIRARPGFSFRDAKNALTWNASNGVAFDAATGTQTGGQYFYINVPDTTLQGLQFRDTNVDAGSAAGMLNLAGANCVVRDCILDGYDQVYMPFNNSGLVDCLIANRCTQPLTGSWPVKWDTPSTGGFAEGCVFAGLGGGAGSLVAILTATAGVGVARNCIFFGATKPLLSQNVVDAWTIDHCALSISALTNDTADGGGNLLSQVAANLFISATVDFRPKTGAATIGAGATDTTYNTVGDDIFENTRVVPWDIGPVKFLGATSSAAFAGTGGISAKAARLSAAASALHGAGGVVATAVKASLLISATLSGAGTAGTQSRLLAATQSALSGSGVVSELPTVISHTITATLTGSGLLGSLSPFSQDFSQDFGPYVGPNLQLLAIAGSSLAGSGFLPVAAIGISPAAAAFLGAGTMAEAIAAQLDAVSVLAGNGVLGARSALSPAINATLGGAGSAGAVVSQLMAAVGSLAGSAALAATPLPLYWIRSSMGGSGSLAASPASLLLAAAALPGAGNLAANAGQANQQFTSGTFAGTGGLIVAETSVLQLAAVLAGAGGVNATMGSATLAVAAALSGAGSLLAAGAMTALAATTLAGTAALTSFVARAMKASAALVGTGGFSATIALLPSATVALGGNGAMSASVIGRLAGSATFAGAGSLIVAPGQPTPGAGALNAAGSLTAAVTRSTTASAVFIGGGSLVAAAPLAFAGASLLAGAGGFVVAETSTLVAGAMLDGDGVMVATAPAEVTFTLNGTGGLVVAEFTISERSGIGVFAAQLQRGAFATDATENQERPPVFGVVTSAQPQRLGDLRAGTEDTRFYDLGDDLGPLGDWVIMAAVIVARRDGATLVQPPDLVITPVGLRSPWLSAAADYPALALTVNWWEGADPTNPGADYLVTVQVTTQQGRVLEYDAYQMVVEDTG